MNGKAMLSILATAMVVFSAASSYIGLAFAINGYSGTYTDTCDSSDIDVSGYRLDVCDDQGQVSTSAMFSNVEINYTEVSTGSYSIAAKNIVSGNRTLKVTGSDQQDASAVAFYVSTAVQKSSGDDAIQLGIAITAVRDLAGMTYTDLSTDGGYQALEVQGLPPGSSPAVGSIYYVYVQINSASGLTKTIDGVQTFTLSFAADVGDRTGYGSVFVASDNTLTAGVTTVVTKPTEESQGEIKKGKPEVDENGDSHPVADICVGDKYDRPDNAVGDDKDNPTSIDAKIADGTQFCIKCDIGRKLAPLTNQGSTVRISFTVTYAILHTDGTKSDPITMNDVITYTKQNTTTAQVVYFGVSNNALARFGSLDALEDSNWIGSATGGDQVVDIQLNISGYAEENKFLFWDTTSTTILASVILKTIVN